MNANETASSSILMHEHDAIRMVLGLQDVALGALERGAAVDAGIFADLSLFFSLFVGKCHHGKEEQLLFPALRSAPEMIPAIDQLEAEHVQGGALVQAYDLAQRTYAAAGPDRYTRADRRWSRICPVPEEPHPGGKPAGAHAGWKDRRSGRGRRDRSFLRPFRRRCDGEGNPREATRHDRDARAQDRRVLRPRSVAEVGTFFTAVAVSRCGPRSRPEGGAGSNIGRPGEGSDLLLSPPAESTASRLCRSAASPEWPEGRGTAARRYHPGARW